MLQDRGDFTIRLNELSHENAEPRRHQDRDEFHILRMDERYQDFKICYNVFLTIVFLMGILTCVIGLVHKYHIPLVDIVNMISYLVWITLVGSCHYSLRILQTQRELSFEIYRVKLHWSMIIWTSICVLIILACEAPYHLVSIPISGTIQTHRSFDVGFWIIHQDLLLIDIGQFVMILIGLFWTLDFVIHHVCFMKLIHTQGLYFQQYRLIQKIWKTCLAYNHYGQHH
jgi:hypothetical protein